MANIFCPPVGSFIALEYGVNDKVFVLVVVYRQAWNWASIDVYLVFSVKIMDLIILSFDIYFSIYGIADDFFIVSLVWVSVPETL